MTKLFACAIGVYCSADFWPCRLKLALWRDCFLYMYCEARTVLMLISPEAQHTNARRRSLNIKLSNKNPPLNNPSELKSFDCYEMSFLVENQYYIKRCRTLGRQCRQSMYLPLSLPVKLWLLLIGFGIGTAVKSVSALSVYSRRRHNDVNWWICFICEIMAGILQSSEMKFI